MLNYKFRKDISNFLYQVVLVLFQEIDDHLPKEQHFMKTLYEFLLSKCDIYSELFKICIQETHIQD